MDDIPLGVLFLTLFILLLLSAFFSGSETGLMTLNRYRLRHLAEDRNHPGARRAQRLLQRPDRLIGVILLALPGPGLVVLSLGLATLAMLITLEIAIFGFFPGVSEPMAVQNMSMIFFFSAILLYILAFVAGFGHELLRMEEKKN